MLIWIAIAALTVAGLLWIVAPLISGGGPSAGRAAYDRRIYRDQLAEIERDLARGLIEAGEAEASRAEVARRLLAADATAKTSGDLDRAPAAISLVAMLVVALGVGGGAVGVYLVEGRPGLPDTPLAERQAQRPGQAQMEARMVEAGVDLAPPPAPGEERLAELVSQLTETLQTRQNDLRGHRLLAGALGRLGHFAEARKAQARVILLAGTEATAQDYADHAELMILAVNGYVSPEAEQALAEALDRDSSLPVARYYAGLALAQNGRLEEAFDLWAGLLREGPADAPWIGPIRDQIGPLAAALGVSVPPVAEPAPGPSAEEMEAARDMSPEERAEMIRGMVEGLAARLAEEGGPAADWARLIRALGVLGETERARAIWTEAQAEFADDAAGLAEIAAAAQAAGISD